MMFKIHILNVIRSGIPELVEYDNEEQFKEEWAQIHAEVVEKYGEENEPSFEESLESGYLVNHKTEYRREAIFPSGIRLSAKDSLVVLEALELGAKLNSEWRRHELILTDRIKGMILQDLNKKKHSHLWPRQCDNCAGGMADGWVWGEGSGYACSERCLFIDGYNREQLQADYEADAIYWTTWELECTIEQLREAIE